MLSASNGEQLLVLAEKLPVAPTVVVVLQIRCVGPLRLLSVS